MWQLSAPAWQFVVRGLFVFGFIVLFLRLTGKRQVGQMTPFDLVLLLLISNSVQNSMNGGDNSITAGLILAASLLTGDLVLSKLTRRFRKIETLVEGQPELLIHNGKVLYHSLAKAGMTHHDLMGGLRVSGVGSIEDVHAAVLETNGRISVLQRPKDGE